MASVGKSYPAKIVGSFISGWRILNPTLVTLVNTTIPLSPLATQLMRPLSIQPKPCHPVLLSFISSLAAPLSPPWHHVIISEWRILSLNPTLVTTTRHECFPRVAQPLQFHSFQHEWTSVWDQPRL